MSDPGAVNLRRLYHEARLRAHRPVELDALTAAEVFYAAAAIGADFDEWLGRLAAVGQDASSEPTQEEKDAANRQALTALKAQGVPIERIPSAPAP